jgi:hypothetical protein
MVASLTSHAKSLSVYSLDEAATYFSTAFALLEKHPYCASDDQIVEAVDLYARVLSMNAEIATMTEVVRVQFVFALGWNSRYREAAAVQRVTSQVASRLGDSRSRAYALAAEIFVSTIVAPKSLHEFEIIKREAIEAASHTADAYIQNWTHFHIGWDEFHRGRMSEARASARKLMEVGGLLADPRSTGLGLALLTWIALVSDSYAEALDYSEQSLAVAVTPLIGKLLGTARQALWCCFGELKKVPSC